MKISCSDPDPSAIGNSYAYNNANQRIRSTLADNSYWVYGYDSLGQVISGNKYWSDNSPVAGQQFGYAFDDIGNRASTQAGGDQNGANLHSASYTPNNLNQYSQRDIPGYVSSLGTANPNATVTLWSEGGAYAQTYRHSDYFWAELSLDKLSLDNSGSALWVALTNLALMHNGSNPDYLGTSKGHEFLPQSSEHFIYDDDGNLTQDGRWQYTWDAENRLIEVTPSTTVGPQISLKFEYDWQGRRTHKQVWDHASWSGTITNDVKFVYDGWNLIAELNALNGSTLLRSYVWGLDLSGTVQGAGGIGGLLFIRNLPSAIWYCPAFDGNGNVSALGCMADSTIAAQYEYGPFGEVIRATGPMAKANPFRFSTKYQDDETDLFYYGYRYYSSSAGRWLNHDPLSEQGFQLIRPSKAMVMLGLAARLAANRAERGNLYALLRNTPLDSLDSLGLCDSKCGKDVTLVVRQTLADIAATFIAAPWYNQDRADISMFGWTPLALGSWDIRYLRYYNYTAPDSEECNGTVTFEGRCVAADELNYMMFGLGIKLCGEDLDTELGALRLALWIRSLGRDLDITQRKVGFAKYGAGGYSTMPGWLTWPHPCSPDKERLPEDVHDWRWSGLKGGPY